MVCVLTCVCVCVLGSWADVGGGEGWEGRRRAGAGGVGGERGQQGYAACRSTAVSPAPVPPCASGPSGAWLWASGGAAGVGRSAPASLFSVRVGKPLAESAHACAGACSHAGRKGVQAQRHTAAPGGSQALSLSLSPALPRVCALKTNQAPVCTLRNPWTQGEHPSPPLQHAQTPGLAHGLAYTKLPAQKEGRLVIIITIIRGLWDTNSHPRRGCPCPEPVCCFCLLPPPPPSCDTVKRLL